jgi:hypothetical protein
MGEAIMYKKLKRNRIGGINGFLGSGAESTLTTEECKKAEAGEWGDISDYTQADKDAHEQEQARATFKTERAQAVDALTIETALGVFDADERSQDRMARAVVAMGEVDTIEWVLNDNTVVTVTAEQLKEALQLAGAAQSALWTQ